MGLNLSKNVTSKHSQKLSDQSRKSTTNTLKTSLKRAIQKTAEAIGYLIGNKIPNKITKVSKTSPQNSLETDVIETKTPKERYISPEEKHKIIGDLRLI